MKIVDKHLEAANRSEVQYNLMDKLTDSLSKDCIVGQVSFTKTTRGALFMVSSSSGVNKFGPLVYEIVMQSIYPAYLRSDYSLKEGSRNVWNKMYQRGDEGYQPSDFGHFWAYRLQASDAKTQELFDAGDVLKRNIAALGIPGMAPFNIREALDLAADLFFHRRYEH